MEHFLEPRIRAVVADHLGVASADLRGDVSLIDDLAADSLDLVELALRIEDEFDITVPERVIESWRTFGDLVDSTLALTALRAEAAGLADAAAPLVRARVLAIGGEAAPRVERVVWLTPYMAETLCEDALSAGRGARLDLRLPTTATDAEIGHVAAHFARLRRAGVDVHVHRDPEIHHHAA